MINNADSSPVVHTPCSAAPLLMAQISLRIYARQPVLSKLVPLFFVVNARRIELPYVLGQPVPAPCRQQLVQPQPCDQRSRECFHGSLCNCSTITRMLAASTVASSSAMARQRRITQCSS